LVNKLPFTLITQRLPLKLLREVTSDIESVLFGVAGFLQIADLDVYKKSTREYLRQLWDRWWPASSVSAKWRSGLAIRLLRIRIVRCDFPRGDHLGRLSHSQARHWLHLRDPSSPQSSHPSALGCLH
jgi:hypothetical protein